MPTPITLDSGPARRRLDRALADVTALFRGMTARDDETQCTCHWGSEEDLTLLTTPDVGLDPDLLHRAWSATGWTDADAVPRRILPQFTCALVRDEVTPMSGLDEVGRCFALAHWQYWPAPQSAAVSEFLRAWWSHSLLAPDPVIPPHALLPLCAEASGGLEPWLTVRSSHTHEVAHRHLASAATEWRDDLTSGRLPGTPGTTRTP